MKTSDIISAVVYNRCMEQSMSGEYLHNPLALSNKIVKDVAIELLSDQRRIIYNSLINEPKSTKVISQEVGLDSKSVSTQLREIYNTTNLIAFTKKGRLFSWYKL